MELGSAIIHLHGTTAELQQNYAAVIQKINMPMAAVGHYISTISMEHCYRVL